MLPDAASPVLDPGLYSGKGPVNAGPGGVTGNILLGSESPYSYDPFGFEATGGYRFLPWLSAGVFFNYASYQVNDGTDSGDYIDGTSQLQRQAWQLGAYIRWYGVAANEKHPGFPYLPDPIFNRLQPWVELQIGYTEDTASYIRGAAQGPEGQPVTQDYYLTYQGLVTNLRIGLDWRLAPIFAVGPVIGYGRAFGVSGCADSEPQSDPLYPQTLPAANSCAPASATNVNTGPAQANGYGIFFGGIFLKVTLGPDVR